MMVRSGDPIEINAVLPYVPHKMNDRYQGQQVITLGGDPIMLLSKRYQVFKLKGVCCVKCGLEATHFYKEKNEGDSRYHLNLYGVRDTGKEVLFTKDHIKAKSKGGSDELSNLQPMCSPCNSKKADK